MKSVKVENEVITSGINQTSNFTIKATARSFDILSSNLYTDKIRAIIRELSTNALDAHVSVGKADIPFDVKLPNRIDLEFYVRDYGPGLTHEQVVGYEIEENGNKIYVGGLYNTYFESTKTHSNDFIGALGLGSKSPFSYVSNFIVESIQQGIKRTYSCYKDHKLLPAVALLATTKTDELDGLTVRLSAKPEDIASFNVKAQQIFKYFDVHPNIIGAATGFKIDPIVKLITGSNWYVDDTQFVGPRVIQGNIIYPIDTVHFDKDEDIKMILSIPVVINVNIGDVDVAASREQLSYDVNTIQRIRELLTVVKDEMYNSIVHEFSKCDTEWEAGLLRLNILHNNAMSLRPFFNAMYSVDPNIWKGNPIPHNIMIPTDILKMVDIHVYRRQSYNKIRLYSVPNSETPMSITRNPCFIIDNYNVARREYIKYKDRSDIEVNYIVFKPKDKKNPLTLDGIKDILPLFGNPEHVFLTDPKPKRQPISNQAINKQVGKLNVFIKGMTTNKNSWTQKTHDFNEGGIYVEYQRYTAIRNDKVVNLTPFVHFAEEQNIIPINTPIFGLTKTEIKVIKDDPKWFNILDLIIDYIVRNKDQVYGYAYQDCMLDMFSHGTMIHWILKNNIKIPQEDSPFWNWINKNVSIIANKLNLNTRGLALIRHAIYLLDIDKCKCLLSNNVYTDVQTKYNEIFDLSDRYGMLVPYIKYETGSEDSLVKLIEYIELVDKNTKI